ncbi:MAG: DNA-binding response regulator [Bryobacteraceae bacterium]|nr:MAG: DNA-binding response regulator [Bryobacteraceae bacterium]
MPEVAIVEDQREVREGLALLISSMQGYQCTRVFGTMEAALRAMEERPADLVLLDIGLPGMDGIEGTKLLKARHPQMEILILSVHGDDDRIFRAICAGASGYLLKSTPPVRILEAIREVLSGGAPMSPEIGRRVMELFRNHRPPAGAEYHLSPQETQLLRLLVDGHYYKTAAAEMGVSVHTVVTYIKNIYRKLHVHSKSEAVAKALREGWFV